MLILKHIRLVNRGTLCFMSIFFTLTIFGCWKSSRIYVIVEREQHLPAEAASLTSLADAYINRDMVFIVGAQSSGTTLVRLLLDSHPQVNCGDETSVTYRVLSLINEGILGDRAHLKFLQDFGVKNETVEKATALFVYYVMENNKKNPQVDTKTVKYLCNKEPSNSKNVLFLHRIFPNAKFVYIIRDGRDAAYSYFVREREGKKVRRPLSFYLKSWNELNKFAHRECALVGERFCFRLRYEKLVSDPEPVLRELMRFLDLPWVDELMHHDSLLNDNKLSISLDPLYKKFPRGQISNSSIGKWRGKVDELEDREFLGLHAPMLRIFNYIDDD